MFSLAIYLEGLAIVVLAAGGTWLVSVFRRNVAIVDSVWSLLFALAAFTYAVGAAPLRPRGLLALCLVCIWALRLSIYITLRNAGHGEDRRYQAIRARNEPYFAFKSLYLVFGLQALLAWVISLPLLGAILSLQRLGAGDFVGTALWVVGMVFEVGGDWQLARFKANPANQSQVMDRGLWSLTRHPNYFGECCIWWGFYCMAVAAGAWWALPAPLLITFMLLKVSGVSLLEKDIGERRPRYADYVRRTNAFLPGPRRP